MKVNVVRDENGKVVATFERAGPGRPSIAPVLKPGHTVHEVETTENYRTDLKAFYTEHSD
jgi:hypothetical protein